MTELLIGIFIGTMLGIVIISLFGLGARADLEKEIIRKNKRIEEQTKIIFELRAEATKYKAMASTEENRADLLQKMKDELQSDYDNLAKDYKEVLTEYKKLYVELDAIKASEVRKFRTPQEIEALLKIDNDFDEVLKELSTIEEMLLEVKPKVLLAS